MRKRLGSLLLCLLLSACSAAREGVPTAHTGPSEDAAKSTYVVGPGDQLQISVYGQPDLSKQYAVSAEGDLSMPLVGSLQVAGRSVVELESEVRQRLAEYLVNPQVTVAVQEFRQRFTILGEVQKPGSYPLEKQTTVLEGISIAGGFTAKAAPNRTRVIRSHAGQEVTIEVPVADIMRGGDQTADVRLQPNDKIVVPESFF